MSVMNSGQEITRLVQAINPYTRNKWIRKFFKPAKAKIEEHLAGINDWLKATYTEENLTRFTYPALLRLFAWEDHIRQHTEQVVAQALPYIQAGDVVFDIGANMGQFARYLSEKKNISVVLFEPVPLYRDYCRLMTAKMPSATVVGKALSDSVGSALLYVDHANLGWNTLIGEKQTKGMQPITVETVTFDEYAREAGVNRIDCMKIDVEGAEYRFFAGARAALSVLRKKPVMLLEIGWGRNHPYRDREVEQFAWLMRNGWQRFDYDYAGTRDVVILPEIVSGGK